MKQKEFFIISIVIFLTVIFWMIADIYHVATTEKVKMTNLERINSIDFNIDLQIFKALKEKK